MQKVLIYLPESHKDFGLVSYGYHTEIDAFDFGLDISDVTKYQAFIELAKKSCIVHETVRRNSKKKKTKSIITFVFFILRLSIRNFPIL